MEKQKIILVAGPTASGKSALAMQLAFQVQGTIINADALQIYSGLPILSAQPSAKDQQEIPHKLYSVLDPSEPSSAGKWMVLATKAIEETVASGRVPILVGGTGLYFKAFFGGLAPIPQIPSIIRDQIQKLYTELGEEKFRHALAQHDPASAIRLSKNDRQRLVRAYEVVAHTNKPLSEWHNNDPKSQNFDPEFHLLLPPREEIYSACNRRFIYMIENGAIEESQSMLERRLDPSLPAMKTLGLREIASYLRGEVSLEDVIIKAQQATRNYAKRQMTWFRNQWKFTA